MVVPYKLNKSLSNLSDDVIAEKDLDYGLSDDHSCYEIIESENLHPTTSSNYFPFNSSERNSQSLPAPNGNQRVNSYATILTGFNINGFRIFNSEEFGRLRTVMLNGSPWFLTSGGSV